MLIHEHILQILILGFQCQGNLMARQFHQDHMLIMWFSSFIIWEYFVLSKVPKCWIIASKYIQLSFACRGIDSYFSSKKNVSLQKVFMRKHFSLLIGSFNTVRTWTMIWRAILQFLYCLKWENVRQSILVETQNIMSNYFLKFSKHWCNLKFDASLLHHSLVNLMTSYMPYHGKLSLMHFVSNQKIHFV